MKLAAAAFVALSLFAGAAQARPIDTLFTDIERTSPHSVFDDLGATAPRSVFDDLQSTAPRSLFDSIDDTAPRESSSPRDLVGE